VDADFSPAIEKAAVRVEHLRQKLNDRVGYVIVENETGRVVTTVAGKH